jgi:hypothetical protein
MEAGPWRSRCTSPQQCHRAEWEAAITCAITAGDTFTAALPHIGG